jgi:transposase
MGRKRWSASEKFRIALIAHKGEETIEEICRRYKVAASQVHDWKKRLISEGSEVFGKSKETNSTVNMNKEISALYEKIGQLTMERDYLKKAWGSVHGKSDFE